MSVLVTGVTDEAAAQDLGWTRRTLQRRLRAAMDKLSARSRLQAGYLLARAGWLERPFSPGVERGSGQTVDE